MLRTMDEGYKVIALNGEKLNPLASFWQMTRGNAEALSIADRIGTLEAGTDADIVVLDARATPAMRLRMETVETLAEELFLLQTLGDDRAVAEVYVAGQAGQERLLASAAEACHRPCCQASRAEECGNGRMAAATSQRLPSRRATLVFPPSTRRPPLRSARRSASAGWRKTCRSSSTSAPSDRPLFYAALPGSTAANADWARRKINVVQMFLKSTYRMVLEQQRPDRTFKPGDGLDIADYVLAGGGFPVTVEGRRRHRRHRRFRPAGARGSTAIIVASALCAASRRCRSPTAMALDAALAGESEDRRDGRCETRCRKTFLTSIFDAAVAAADPELTIRKHLPAKPKGRTIVIGAGKGSAQMAAAFEKAWDGPLEGAGRHPLRLWRAMRAHRDHRGGASGARRGRA